MLTVMNNFFLMASVALLIGCTQPPALTELPDHVFEAEEEHTGPRETVGHLGEAYIVNTTALRKSNNKLRTICIAANRCKDEQPHDEGPS